MDRHALAVRLVHGAAALDVRGHLVACARAGEGAADHDVVVEAPRRVVDEVARRDAERAEIFRGGRAGRDRPDGRDVIGGEHVAEHGEHARTADVARRLGLGAHVVEKGRPADERTRFLPWERRAGAGGKRAPLRRALAYVGVTLPVKRRVDRLRDDAVDLAALRPYVTQIHRAALRILAQRL